MTLPEAVLFDLYDTLVGQDWSAQTSLVARHLGLAEVAVAEAYAVLAAERDGGLQPDAAAVLAAVARHCGANPTQGEIDALVQLEAELLGERVRLYPDSLPVLRELRRRGHKTAIVSNCSPSTRPVLERLRLAEEVDTVVLSFEVGVAKPAAGIFEFALERLGVGAGAGVFVDDRVDYLDGAASLGLRTVQISRTGPSPSGGHPVVGDLRELSGLL